MQKRNNSVSVITDGSYRAEQANALAAALSVFELPKHVQISVGMDAVDAALATEAEFKVHILDPQKRHGEFDLILAPSYEPHYKGANVSETFGLINHISPEYLEGKERDFGIPKPYAAVLIGGKHVGGNITVADAERLADMINRQGHSALITNSRRTEKPVLEKLKTLLTVPHYIYDFNYDGQDGNPFEAILASSESIIVSADSVRMVSESCSSGRPTEIFVPKQVHFSYMKLAEEMAGNGFTVFGSLNEAAACADIIMQIISK